MNLEACQDEHEWVPVDDPGADYRCTKCGEYNEQSGPSPRWSKIQPLARAIIADWGIINLCLDRGDLVNAKRQASVMGQALLELADLVGLSERLTDVMKDVTDVG